MSRILILILIINAIGQAAAAPVHDAARDGDLSTIQEIVAQSPGAVNLADDRGQTPLHHAVIKNRTPVVQWLLEAGASVDPVDRSGQTPLFIALDRSRNRVAMILLNQGADTGRLGRGEVGMAVRSGNLNAVKMMIVNGSPLEVADGNGLTPLAVAVSRGRIDIAQQLLENGADPETRLPGNTPMICWAAATGKSGVVDLLLAEGADAQATAPDGRTARWLAQAHGHPHIARVLPTIGHSPVTNALPSASELLEKIIPYGEAIMWHLGHCGWAIRTREHLLVFDYFPNRWQPAHPSLANGLLVPEELADQKVYVFVTHGHRDHFDPAIFDLADIGATYLFGFRPTSHTGPAFTHVAPRSRHEVDGITINSIDSNDEGVGFLVSVDGITVYHAGDHAGWKEDQKNRFTGEIDHLAAMDQNIDLAFLNVTGCHTHGQCALEDGTRYTLSKLKPRVWFPTHAGDQEHLYSEFSDRVGQWGFQSTMGIPVFRGETFYYREGKLVEN